jgi:RNA polymerase sigma-70 factor (ECF subfamily)
MSTAVLERARIEGWTDEQVVERVLAGDTEVYEIIMRRYNQRLYRVARGILHDDHEAEDVMQQAYVRAFEHLNQFEGRAKFSTWLTRIAVHEALARLHRRGRMESIEPSLETNGENMLSLTSTTPDPESEAGRRELISLLENAVLALPQQYRSVLVMRDIEQLSTSETAQCLDMSEDNVKIRLHRARAMLRRELFTRAGATSSSAFLFMGERCDRVVRNVFAQIR